MFVFNVFKIIIISYIHGETMRVVEYIASEQNKESNNVVHLFRLYNAAANLKPSCGNSTKSWQKYIFISLQ